MTLYTQICQIMIGSFLSCDIFWYELFNSCKLTYIYLRNEILSVLWKSKNHESGQKWRKLEVCKIVLMCVLRVGVTAKFFQYFDLLVLFSMKKLHFYSYKIGHFIQHIGLTQDLLACMLLINVILEPRKDVSNFQSENGQMLVGCNF